MNLPPLPVCISGFIPFISEQEDLNNALEPYKNFEGKLREVFAQDKNSKLTADPHVNTCPIFAGHESTLSIRARELHQEDDATKQKYLLPLSEEDRRPAGSPAIVASMKEFKTNFNLFSESSLVDLDWSNVVAAGSSVVTSLLPVKSPHNQTKRALRAYYHEQLAPASDVDLFIYGLDEAQAIEKIKKIESCVKDSILSETTTIRTRNSITIASEYPTRHVQIVLRLYKSVSEILTGFDIDCSCVAYDGAQVWASPRAIAAYMTQINTIDLTRRSPSYENRLSKYARRGFEVFWPGLDRSRVDPTIFERSFSRVVGLARLLVLEKLPHASDRDEYLAKRREERGRPPLPWNARYKRQLPGNIKDSQPEDVAEWVEEDDVSNYHSLTVPYGPRYNAKKIERLLFTKDLLLNSEWNRAKDRETDLHRHPAFFGSATDVIDDCCGFCPAARTDEDFTALEEEEKIFVSGSVKFLRDDPGRQAIGSFNPITVDDWTEMAYVGNTASLCQAIVDKDIERVQDWFSQGEVDPNRRDHTGRTPLQLATMCSTPQIVRCLIENGARIVARLVDGMTALHIAAHRGEVDMVRALLEKSEANEAEEAEKEDIRKKARRAANAPKNGLNGKDIQMKDNEEDDEDVDDLGEDTGSEDSDRMTDASFVKVMDTAIEKDVIAGDGQDEPDVYNVDVLSWDSPVSPLHLAIIGGHNDVVGLLVDTFGADVLLPVKIMQDGGHKTPRAVILTIALALQLPLKDAHETVKALLSKGASSTQADADEVSALHYVVNSGKTVILDAIINADGPASSRAINHIVLSGWESNLQVDTPLLTAIRAGKTEMAQKLLELGAHAVVDPDSFAQAFHRKFERASRDPHDMKKNYQSMVDQPIVEAVRGEMPHIVQMLLDRGADKNTLPKTAWVRLSRPDNGWSDGEKVLLDLLRDKINVLKDYKGEQQPQMDPIDVDALGPDDSYLAGLEKKTYRYWLARKDLDQARAVREAQVNFYTEMYNKGRPQFVEGEEEKIAAVLELLAQMQALERKLLSMGAKTFYELHPEFNTPKPAESRPYQYNRFGLFGFNQMAHQEPYKTRVSFVVPDLNGTTKEGYVQLFEAAWVGNVNEVKRLTLGDWKLGQPALQIAVQDQQGFSPFSIAMLRGHIDLAKLTLEIANVQYAPRQKTERFRYSLPDLNMDDEGSDSDGDDNIHVVEELIDDKFTVDDIIALADNVRSNVSPMELLLWTAEVWRTVGDQMNQTAAKDVFMLGGTPNFEGILVQEDKHKAWRWFNEAYSRESRNNRFTLFRCAIAKNDMEMLQSLLKIGADLAERKEDADASKVFRVSDDDFSFAARLGRTDMLSEIIKTTGAAIPLHILVKKSGFELHEKPNYYQGLSVYGKKRKDWADAGHRTLRAPVESETSPLLSIIFEGNVDSTEFMMSDAPLRRYTEFVSAHQDDKRVVALSRADGGINKALRTWLETRNHLATFMAVMSEPREDGSNPNLDFLIRYAPETIDAKSADGRTPLHIAFELNRFYAAKALIRAGANQALRTLKGENLIHLLVLSGLCRPPLLRSVLALLDPKLIKLMLLERSATIEPGSITPLALFVERHAGSVEWATEVFNIFFEYTGGKDLEVMNGAGDYILHSLVRKGYIDLVRFIVELNPSLLFRENAMGMTPFDIASSTYLRYIMDNPPYIEGLNRSYTYNHSSVAVVEAVKKSPRQYFEESKNGTQNLDLIGRGSQYLMWKTANELAAKYPSKRTLVSVHDANEVAKRLAERQEKMNRENKRRAALGLRAGGYRGRNYFRYQDDYARPKNGELLDEVWRWMGKANLFKKKDLERWEMEFDEKNKSQEEEGGRKGKSLPAVKRVFTPDSDSDEQHGVVQGSQKLAQMDLTK